MSFPLFSQEQKERLRLIHADVLQRETVGTQIKQMVEGNVKFQQGSTIILCDLAIQTLNQDPTALIGQVQIFDETKTLFADTVYFYQNDAKQVASGNVISISEKDTTKADRLTYYKKENKIISENNVRIINPEERTVLKGGYVDYLREEKYGKIFQNPIYIKFDSLGIETMTIIGDTMEFFDDGRRTLVTGDVKIIQQGSNATCKRAEYFKEEERTLLTENPSITQSNQKISGDTLKLFLENSQLIQARVIGNAEAISDADSLNKGRWVNKLTGQTMNLFFKDKKLEKVIIENQATSRYHHIENNEYRGVNEVSGDKIVIILKNDKIKHVTVTSNPEFASGKFSPPKL